MNPASDVPTVALMFATVASIPSIQPVWPGCVESDQTRGSAIDAARRWIEASTLLASLPPATTTRANRISSPGSTPFTVFQESTPRHNDAILPIPGQRVGKSGIAPESQEHAAWPLREMTRYRVVAV